MISSVGSCPSNDTPSKNRAPSSSTIDTTIEELIDLLREPESREAAVYYLKEATMCTHKTCPKTCMVLALQLWESFNIVYILLEELISLYRYLAPVSIDSRETNKACNVLALLQVMATHPIVRMGMLRARVPAYVYPFLQTIGDDKAVRYLKIASLGVIGAMVKCDESCAAEVVHFLLQTEVFPLCLLCMDNADELTQEVATFIVLRILMQEEGKIYCCSFADRFFSVNQVLARLVDQLVKKRNVRLLKNVIHCYLRLSEAPRFMGVRRRVTEALKQCLPAKLKDDTFLDILRENPEITRSLQQLFHNITAELEPLKP